ncbi:hypothetical protein SLE2022_243620 [Rubroshorea leprosula]
MELCDYSLSRNKDSQLFTEGKLLKVLFQIAKALQYIHERGIAHLDTKPENIYVKNGVYKLGDFGCATLLNKSLAIEEGGARYMPQEILNENYDHLDKVDVFSLGAAIYELIRQSPFSESGAQFLRDGKLPLLPGHSLQFQNLLKVMVERDPSRRPSAKEIVENPIFDKIQRKICFPLSSNATSLIKNPYLEDASKTEIHPSGNQRSKCAGFFRLSIGGDGLSRYHTDFHEID